MSTETDVAIMHTIQDLSRMKYFYNNETTLSALDSYLERRGILLTLKERKKVLKKFYRTLERLGYRNHAGGEQTVEIVRSH